MKQPLILIINPGSTSTKTAVYRRSKPVFETTVKHSRAVLEKYERVADQIDFREEVVLKELKKNGISPAMIDIVIGRGGLLRPVEGGVYKVSTKMKKDLSAARYGEHASNLGALIADSIAREAGVKAYIADPVVVDELQPVSRISGFKGIERKSIFHALSQKMAARKTAEKLGKKYTSCNVIIAHIGGGVSVGVHRKGKVIDVNNALEGEGPFSPERTGGLPLVQFYEYVKKQKLSEKETTAMIEKRGGLVSLLGTNDCGEIESEIKQGNRAYKLMYDAFILQVAKEVGAGAAVLSGKVDAIGLTGSVVNGNYFTKNLKKRISFIAPVYVFRKNLEMPALAAAALSVYTGKAKSRRY